MNDIADLDKQLRFIVKAKPRSFLFILVPTTELYDHVLVKLHECTDLSIVELSGEINVFDAIKQVSSDTILLDVDPTVSSFLKRLDYLRDSLYGLNKLLIFIFFLGQYDKVLCDYPDFYAYASLVVNYTEKLPVPFTLLFSNNSLSYDIKNIFSSGGIWVEQRSADILTSVRFRIEELRYTKMRPSELQKLDQDVSGLLEKVEVKDFTNVTDETNSIVFTVLKYLEVLSSKERFNLMTKKLLELYNRILPEDEVSSCIDAIYNSCIRSLSNSQLSAFYGQLLFSTVKILIPYYTHSNSSGDLQKAYVLSFSRIRWILQSQLSLSKAISGNVFVESYNDMLILEYIINGDLDRCLYCIDQLERSGLNYEQIFLLTYNKAILLLMSGRYEDALDACKDFMESYKHFQGSGMAYYRIQLIRNWVRGVYDRHLQESIDSNIGILKNHRSVFSENHYSIAEIHFCNAYMFYELKDLERSRHCVKKAQNILNQNHSARLKRLKELVNEFANKLE